MNMMHTNQWGRNSGFAFSPETTLRNTGNPTSPRFITCQSLGLIFPCNKVRMVDPGIGSWCFWGDDLAALTNLPWVLLMFQSCLLMSLNNLQFGLHMHHGSQYFPQKKHSDCWFQAGWNLVLVKMGLFLSYTLVWHSPRIENIRLQSLAPVDMVHLP